MRRRFASSVIVIGGMIPATRSGVKSDIAFADLDRGVMFDDLVDSSWMPTYENNHFSHCEELFQYDHRERKQTEGVAEAAQDFVRMCVERGFQVGLAALDPSVRKICGPLQYDYHQRQRKVLGALDVAGVSDTTFYTDEA